MSHNDTQHIKIQVGDTSQPLRIRLTSLGRAYAIPANFEFVLNMVSVGEAGETIAGVVSMRGTHD